MNIEEYIVIFRNLNASIYNYIFIRVRSKEIAQDLTQEVFMKLWINKDRYNADKSNIKTWVYKLTRNHLIDYYRKRKIDITNEGIEEAATEFNEMQDVELDFVLKKLKILSQDEQDLIIMKYIEGLDNSEISKVINKNIGATKVAIVRAFNRLKRIVNQ